MQYTPEIAARCANIGALLLDQYDPNWVSHIDLGDLKMSSGHYCIVGQLYTDMVTDYTDALCEKFGEPRWQALVTELAVEHPDLFEAFVVEDAAPDIVADKFLGFDVPYVDDADYVIADETRARYFRWVQDAWESEIKERLETWKTTT